MERKREKPSQQYGAAQKAEAVLSIWTERRKPLEVCRELGIGWTILNQWQERAMEGMLQALEPRVNLDRCPALSPRLAAMLAKRQVSDPLAKLERRIAGRMRKPKETASEPDAKQQG